MQQTPAYFSNAQLELDRSEKCALRQQIWTIEWPQKLITRHRFLQFHTYRNICVFKKFSGIHQEVFLLKTL